MRHSSIRQPARVKDGTGEGHLRYNVIGGAGNTMGGIMNKFLRTILYAAGVAAILSACAPSTPSPQAIQTAIAQTQTAGHMSEKLAYRLNRMIDEGSTLVAMTIQGTTFSEYRQQLARFKGAYGAALSASSVDHPIPEEVIIRLSHANTAWDLALSVWDAKQNGGGAPHAPNAVRYKELVEYVGLDKLPFLSGVPGQGDVDANEVIRTLWGTATDDFGYAEYLLLGEVQ
jgi:hypothetical protein